MSQQKKKKKHSLDKRVFLFNLTEKGKKKYEKLDELSSLQVEELICHLEEDEQSELADLLSRAKFLIQRKWYGKWYTIYWNGFVLIFQDLQKVGQNSFQHHQVNNYP